ncbi:MAG: hypothetical protein U1F37_19025 [Alphaproteobacteria bacterium]
MPSRRGRQSSGAMFSTNQWPAPRSTGPVPPPRADAHAARLACSRGQQRRHDVSADEAVGAGIENAHAVNIATPRAARKRHEWRARCAPGAPAAPWPPGREGLTSRIGGAPTSGFDEDGDTGAQRSGRNAHFRDARRGGGRAARRWPLAASGAALAAGAPLLLREALAQGGSTLAFKSLAVPKDHGAASDCRVATRPIPG